MFAYCNNNPTNCSDSSGQIPIGIGIGIAVGFVLLLAGCSSESDSNYGAATPYEPTNATNYNCYAYALGETQWKYVGGHPDAVTDFDVDVVAEMVLADAAKAGISMRPIDSYDSPIESNEYRIALRVSSDDYHFMRQHSDGTWSHKPSIASSRLLIGDNPSDASWDGVVIDGYAWKVFGTVVEIDSIANYYNSETRYFAVTI